MTKVNARAIIHRVAKILNKQSISIANLDGTKLFDLKEYPEHTRDFKFYLEEHSNLTPLLFHLKAKFNGTNIQQIKEAKLELNELDRLDLCLIQLPSSMGNLNFHYFLWKKDKKMPKAAVILDTLPDKLIIGYRTNTNRIRLIGVGASVIHKVWNGTKYVLKVKKTNVGDWICLQ